MESTARRLPGLDLLRAIAVLWVITFHFHLLADDMPLSSFGQFGWMGVDLFFVLSHMKWSVRLRDDKSNLLWAYFPGSKGHAGGQYCTVAMKNNVLLLILKYK